MRAFASIYERGFKQAMRYSHPLSVAMIDSDNLKVINDTYGHDAGNRLLQHIVNRMREELRGSDVVARYGGDEFVVLLTQTGPEGAMDMAERIRRAVEASRLELPDQSIRATDQHRAIQLSRGRRRFRVNHGQSRQSALPRKAGRKELRLFLFPRFGTVRTANAAAIPPA
jgi:diguanylate cyclase (GGDEF)-like protein